VRPVHRVHWTHAASRLAPTCVHRALRPLRDAVHGARMSGRAPTAPSPHQVVLVATSATSGGQLGGETGQWESTCRGGDEEPCVILRVTKCTHPPHYYIPTLLLLRPIPSHRVLRLTLHHTRYIHVRISYHFNPSPTNPPIDITTRCTRCYEMSMGGLVGDGCVTRLRQLRPHSSPLVALVATR